MGIGEVGERLRRSTVYVRSGRNGGGSGVIWDDSGVVVTSAHVVQSRDLAIELWDGRVMQARLGRRDVRRDLAILDIQPSDVQPSDVQPSDVQPGGLEPASPGDSSLVRAGEFVIAVGNPLGFSGALSTGVVKDVGRDFIKTSVRLAPGNSGGPLADAQGNVIGINAAIVAGGLGLAVPANAVRRLLESAPSVELGVTVRPVRITGLRILAPGGGIALLVLGVATGGPADYASLRPGDLLIGAGGKMLASIDDLRESLDNYAGRAVPIQFLRGHDPKKREVTVRLIHGMAA